VVTQETMMISKFTFNFDFVGYVRCISPFWFVAESEPKIDRVGESMVSRWPDF